MASRWLIDLGVTWDACVEPCTGRWSKLGRALVASVNLLIKNNIEFLISFSDQKSHLIDSMTTHPEAPNRSVEADGTSQSIVTRKFGSESRLVHRLTRECSR